MGIDPSGKFFTAIGQLVVNSIQKCLRGIKNYGIMRSLKLAGEGVVASVVLAKFASVWSRGPKATALSLGFEASIQLGNLPVAAAGSFEFLIGRQTLKSALFTGKGASTKGGFAGSFNFGVVFNADISGDYEGPSTSATFNSNLIPEKLRSSILTSLQQGLPAMISALSQAEGYSDWINLVGENNINSLWNSYLQVIQKFMSGSSVTAFVSNTNNVIGLQFSPGFLEARFYGMPDNFFVNQEWFDKLYPDNDVSF
jgi:hypothetical protein